ncbi:MAG: septum formation initiator family protein [Pseudomonadota bacterium]
MPTLTRHKRRSHRWLYAFRAGMALFGIYFAYHAFHGNHGLIAHAELELAVENLVEREEALRARKTALEARVAALSAGSLDGDLLDERARHVLGLIGERERILVR